MRQFIEDVLAVLAGGPIFAILGLAGFAFDLGFLWAVSLAGVVLVSVVALWRARRKERFLYGHSAGLITCFHTCVVPEAPGMELEVAATYSVGLFRREDYQEIRYIVGATTERTLAKHIFVGKQNAPGDTASGYTFDTLRKMRFEIEDVTGNQPPDADPPSVCAVPYRISANRLYLVLGFKPPIDKGRQREVRVGLRRVGLWDELRKHGADPHCAYTTAEIPTNKLRIRVVIPHSRIHPNQLRIIPEAQFASAGSISTRRNDAAHGPEAVWDIDHPTPNTRYEYSVECRPLRSVFARGREMIRRVGGG